MRPLSAPVRAARADPLPDQQHPGDTRRRDQHVLLHPGGGGAELAQKFGQLQPFVAVFLQECVGQLASSGPT